MFSMGSGMVNLIAYYYNWLYSKIVTVCVMVQTAEFFGREFAVCTSCCSSTLAAMAVSYIQHVFVDHTAS